MPLWPAPPAAPAPSSDAAPSVKTTPPAAEPLIRAVVPSSLRRKVTPSKEDELFAMLARTAHTHAAPAPPAVAPPLPAEIRPAAGIKLIAIGASTGGTDAIADVLHITPRYNPGARRIRHAAVCGGAGGNYAAQAARHPLRPQAMVTGEARHHEFLQAAAAGLTLYDAAHYNTEAPALSQLLGQLRTALPEVQFLRAESYDGTLICG